MYNKINQPDSSGIYRTLYPQTVEYMFIQVCTEQNIDQDRSDFQKTEILGECALTTMELN